MAKKAGGGSIRDRFMWSPIGTATYELYGRRYRFEICRPENGAHFAWCKQVKKWAWLFSDRILFEGEGAVMAKCLEFRLKK